MRLRPLLVLFVLAAAVADPALAPAAGDCPEGMRPRQDGSCPVRNEVAESEAQRSLLMQKRSLLQAYLKSDSIRRVRNAGNPEATALVEAAEQNLSTASRSLEQGQLKEAAAALDEGLKSASMASSRAAKPRRSAEQERQRYERLHGQIRSYLDAIGTAMTEGESQGRPDKTLARIDGLVSEAEQLAISGRHGNANELLADAYQMTVTLVSRLRKGTTLVSTLNFATPADELEYERRRNGSYEMLVTIMLDERQSGTAPLKKLADRYLAESRELRSKAERHAAAGEFREAIVSMEEASARLIRILQAGGLPVPQ